MIFDTLEEAATKLEQKAEKAAKKTTSGLTLFRYKPEETIENSVSKYVS